MAVFTIKDPKEADRYKRAVVDRRPITTTYMPDASHLKKVTGIVQSVIEDLQAKPPTWRITIIES